MLSDFNPPVVHWLPILPMIVVALTGMIALLCDMFRAEKNNSAAMSAALVGLGLSMLILLRLPGESYETMAGMVNLTGIGILGQIVTVLSAFLVILFSESYLADRKITFGEFYPLILWATFGGMVMCSSTNLLTIFVGLEIMSVSLYVLAGLKRGNMRSAESALKYFLLGGFATGFLLYGIAFFYGGSGSLDLAVFNGRWQSAGSEDRLSLTLAVGFILVGLSFKSSLMPFHQWTPDVYQGSPSNVVAFMATAGKIGPFVALWHFAGNTSRVSHVTIPIFAVLAVITMTGGNILAFAQRDLKRMLAYSSIANAGYVMVPMTAAATGKIGYEGISFFMLGYALTTIGTFTIVSMLPATNLPNKTTDALNGLAKSRPLAAAGLVVFALSMIGLPITVGFLGKFLFVRDAITAGMPWLAIVLVLNSIFGAVYYFGMVRAAFTPGSEGSPTPSFRWCPATAATVVICMVGVIGSMVFYGPITQLLGSR